MTWQSPEIIFAACAVGVAGGFVVGRWWSIPTIVAGWLIYVFLIDGQLAPTGLEGRLNEILATSVMLHVLATTWLVGIATATGFAVRFAIRRRAQRVLKPGSGQN
jgi:hypothetical protein